MKKFLYGGLAAVVAVLAGCASPPSQYYTLVPEAGSAKADVKAAKPAFAIRVLPVTVPDQVDRPQIVLSTPGSAELTPLNGSLWAAPLPHEIRQALSGEITAQLGVLDVLSLATTPALPVWDIGVTVQRFDSVYGREARLDATWRLEKKDRKASVLEVCRTDIRVPVADEGVPAMVGGQQRAVKYLAEVIAAHVAGKPLDAPREHVAMKGCV